MTETALYFYLTPMLFIWGIYYGLRTRRQRRATRLRDESQQSGLVVPASLHPVIDSCRCLGCRSCISACPEKNVLGIIDSKSELVSPANCIGHGACKTACPMNAITLVFGTSKRGVDIPVLTPSYETTVPRIFIAGELGGMGLIRNAIEQGKKAVDSITKIVSNAPDACLDLLIVGAGPAGCSASLRAMELKMNFGRTQ